MLSGEDLLILGWAVGVIARVPVEHTEEPADLEEVAQDSIRRHRSRHEDSRVWDPRDLKPTDRDGHPFHPVDTSTNEEDQSE